MNFSGFLRTVSLFLLFSASQVLADIQLPALISDFMVLKKSAQTPIWGRADPGEKITVTLASQTVSTQSDPDGRWKVIFNLEKSAPGPFDLIVQGIAQKITVSDVLIGEVWVASGQSNMEWSLKFTENAKKEIAASTNSNIRQFTVKKNPSVQPLDNTEGRWEIASPETTANFSAVGWYFAKKLQTELQVPIGILHSSWGGTPSEAWTSPDAIDSVPDLQTTRERQLAQVTEYPLRRKTFVEDLQAWTKKHQREDTPTPDAPPFAASDLSTQDWVKVLLPGVVKAPGLAEAGAVWLRKEVIFPEAPSRAPGFVLPINGFDRVYWNGKLLAQTTADIFPGLGFVRRGGSYMVPRDAIQKGSNTLAIRLYQPVAPAVFFGQPALGNIVLTGEWLAKTEIAFPALPPEILATAPVAPPQPAERQYLASFLFQGMIHPLLSYAISGAIWYQGESNVARAWQYRTAFPLLINDWRRQWNQGDFPFYFCQLANFTAKNSAPVESPWAELREAQAKTLSLPNTGMAVLIDIGESDDIHPINKKDVGERLARIALARDYGKKISYSGPMLDSATFENGRAILTFKYADGGLVAQPIPKNYPVRLISGQTAPLVRNSPRSELEGFAICGEDKKWVWANAKIDGDRVVVSSAKVGAPIAVRYNWADNPSGNLSNGEGLPASPFRTDDFPAVTLDVKY